MTHRRVRAGRRSSAATRLVAPPRMGAGACLILLGIVAACGPNSTQRSGAGEAEDTVTVLVTSENWWMANLPSHTPVFLSLFHDHAGENEGRLVRDWEKHADGRTWTYHLRTDVRWHDGAPVTAHDVKFTIDLLTHPDLLFMTPNALTVEVLDDSTLAITFLKPTPDWGPLESMAPVYPRHLLASLTPADIFDWDFWRHPVGNGPFRFVRGEPRMMVELEANPDFYRGRPDIDHVILVLRDGIPRTQLRAGEVDILDAFVVGPAEAFDIAQDQQFDAYWSIGAWQYHILWNPKHPLFADVRVRQALTRAIDRHEIKTFLRLPNDAPMIDVPLTPRQRVRLDFPEPAPSDPALARTLLERAGWFDRDGDGIRERDGETLRFTLLNRFPDLAVLLQDQFRRVGVMVDIETAPGQDTERTRVGDFDAVLRQGRLDHRSLTTDLIDALYAVPNPELGRLLQRAGTIIDPIALDSAYEAMWPILRETVPVTVLVPNLWASVMHTRIRGLESPHRTTATLHLDELWIEREEDRP